MAIVPPINLRGGKFWQMLQRWDWVLVILIAPLLLFPNPGRPWVFLVVPLILMVQTLAWGNLLPITPLNPAILLLSVMVCVSIFVTPDLANSLGKIAGMLLGIIIYFTVIRHTRSRSGLIGSLALFTLAGCCLALIGIIGTNWGATKLLLLNALYTHLPISITGLAGAESGIHPYELAGSLLWIIPVILLTGLARFNDPGWFAKREKGDLRSRDSLIWGGLFLLVFFIDLGLLLLTQSRGSYLAIAITTIILMILIPKWPARWWVVGVLAVDMIAGMLLAWRYGWKNLVDQMMGSLHMDAATLSIVSMSWREEIWTRAIWTIKAVPLTGLGMNVFRNSMGILYPTFQFSAASDLAHAHNELLQAAVDLGLPGLVGFLALYIGAVVMLVPLCKSSGAVRLLALGFLGGLMAHFIFGITDAVALGAKPAFLFWWLLGMIFGLYEQCKKVRLMQGE